jgi:hypothetical protein
MRLAMVPLSTIAVLLNLVPVQAVPMGSANSLSGLEERSVQQTPVPSSNPSFSNQTAQSNQEAVGLRLNSNLQLRVSPERDKNLSGIYPEDSTATGNRIQLFYEIDQAERK